MWARVDHDGRSERTGAALLVNAVPHGVSGVQGRPFPSPFGDPPGVGMSSPQVNVGWSAANAIVGVLLLGRGVRSPAEAVGAAAGAVAMAIVISYHSGDVLAGGRGLRGTREERPADGGSGPPRGLVKATEPIAKALAGRRGFPLWAVVHHRGRKSGTDYTTPVAVVPTMDPNLVLIGLPWGPKTNWAPTLSPRASRTSPGRVPCARQSRPASSNPTRPQPSPSDCSAPS